MKIELKPGFAAFVMLLLLFCGEYAVLFLTALCLHEAGHFAACCILGGRSRRFCLRFADCEIETVGLGYRSEAICAMAGPAVSGISFILLRSVNPAFAAIHLLLAVYNLLPVWPLDGARSLFCLLSIGMKPDTAWTIVRICGLTVCGVLLIFALAASIIWKLGLWPLAAALLLYSRLALSAGWQNSCFFEDATIK